MILWLIDTDHYSLQERGHPELRERLASVPPRSIAISVVTMEEMFRGRLAMLSRQLPSEERVHAYQKLLETASFFESIPVLPFDMACEQKFQELRARRVRIAPRQRSCGAGAPAACLSLPAGRRRHRLGVDFPSKEPAGQLQDRRRGAKLARLTQKQLHSELALLAEMKLLERDEDERYTVHPAVRDGFLKSLDDAASRQGHEAARKGLEVSLGKRPGENPSDPATLDLLEEIVHHTLSAGHVKEAWSVYWNRIGGGENLLWRLGAYERGERISRAFAKDSPPEDARLPGELSEHTQAILIASWVLYLKNLGRLAAAARCHEGGIEIVLRQEKWNDASTGKQNLASILFLSGRLRLASEAAKEALYLGEQAENATACCYSCAYSAHVHMLRGQTSRALVQFSEALHWQNRYETKSPLLNFPGVCHTLLLTRIGLREDATHLAEANLEICTDAHERDASFCRLVLAELARDRQDLADAYHFLDAAHEWAIARDAKEPLCWAALVRSRLERNRVRTSHRDEPDGARCMPYDSARRAVEDGLRIARDCGFGIYHIDLLLLRARLALEEGDVDQAITDIDIALFKGVHLREESGLPELLAATESSCGYAWGEAEGRQLRAEALLHQAAWLLGRGEFAPARAGELPEGARRLIDEARQELETCRRLREKIQDPKVTETRDVLEQLDGGVLTRHPLRLVTASGEENMSDGALKIWIERLDFIETEIAKTSDAKQKFSLKKEVEEIKTKIVELGGEVPEATPSADAPKEPAGACKILFLAANPTADRLALDEEVRAIEAKIRASEHRDTLKLISKWAVRPDDLMQALNEHEPHIVHFSGHGYPTEEIVLQGADGQPKPVGKRALVKLFKTFKDNIRLVVLNACYSKPQAEAIVGIVDCAVGMSQEIGDEAARTFSASFYRALGFGRSVQGAFDQGETSLLLEDIPEEGTAELLTRDGVEASEVVLVRPS